MKYFFFFFISAFFSFSLLAQTINSIKVSQSPTNNVYAVIVGISSYSDADVPQLQFANRDAEVFAGFLRSKSGGSVPKENIRLLTDSSATSAAVYNAIYWVKKNAKKDDVVFFYFSGHGDLENITMYNNAYLICYNSPPQNYVGMALSVEYLNDIANTLSVQTKAKVVLITDACHSGKLAGNSFKGNLLVGEQLMATKEKEIRIASCKPDQLSNEKSDWGRGRGIFSYYLVNGLMGLADKSKDSIVTLGEIKNYLQTSLANDPVLKQDKTIQTPVLNGNDGFPLSTVVQSEFIAARQMVTNDSISNQLVLSSAPFQDDMTGIEPDDYFFSLLKKQSLEALTDSLQLDKLTAEEIPFALINRILLLKKQSPKDLADTSLLNQFTGDIPADVILRTRDSIEAAAGLNKINELKNNLINNTGALAQFNSMLTIAFDDKGQEVIGQYLKGDEAELERRRYYNVKSSGYDVYPKMFEVALKLTQPDNFFYKILQVKLHYFTGVAMRLKLPLTENTDSLIALAFTEQKKALELETHAAYIYNELGILYLAKKEIDSAENNFIKATGFAPRWAIPWANLAYLYAVSNRNENGFDACSKADSLQAGLPCTSNNFGLLYENSGNQLFAEEYYRASVDLNSRHYLPFERLGYVYLNTTQYALADSFFYEADLRKQDLHFKKGVEPLWWINPLDYAFSELKPCTMDTSILLKDDVMAFFNWGMSEYQKNNIANAIRILKKVIDIDKQNPLAFHYLGKIFYEQKKWEDAELMFKYAIQFYLDTASFYQYCDSVIKKTKYPYPHDCFEIYFRTRYYKKIEDYYFIATAYETWGHFEEAETMYKAIIQLQPNEIGGYVKCLRML
ncbi:MAG: caspase family protein, partial [Ferruginibacter sp.]